MLGPFSACNPDITSPVFCFAELAAPVQLLIAKIGLVAVLL